MTGAELPTGDELVPHLDGYDDDLLAAYVCGLLEHFELKASRLDPYDATTLSDFADMMVQDVIVAAQGGNVSPLIQFAYRGIVDVAKDVWLEDRENGIETNDDADIGDAILFALRGALDADSAAQAGEEPTERDHGRLYGLLRRFRACAGVIPSPSQTGFVRPPGFGVDYLCPESGTRRERPHSPRPCQPRDFPDSAPDIVRRALAVDSLAVSGHRMRGNACPTPSREPVSAVA